MTGVVYQKDRTTLPPFLDCSQPQSGCLRKVRRRRKFQDSAPTMPVSSNALFWCQMLRV